MRLVSPITARHARRGAGSAGWLPFSTRGVAYLGLGLSTGRLSAQSGGGPHRTVTRVEIRLPIGVGMNPNVESCPGFTGSAARTQSCHLTTYRAVLHHRAVSWRSYNGIQVVPREALARWPGACARPLVTDQLRVCLFENRAMAFLKLPVLVITRQP